MCSCCHSADVSSGGPCKFMTLLLNDKNVSLLLINISENNKNTFIILGYKLCKIK